MSAKMEATVLANNMTDAQAALQLHQERKAEIDGRQTNFLVSYILPSTLNFEWLLYLDPPILSIQIYLFWFF